MKNLKKSLGLFLAAILMITSVGNSAKAAKWISWPYGTYKHTKYSDTKIFFGYYSDASDKYEYYTQSYYKGTQLTDELFEFKKTKTVNKYKSRQYGMKGARDIPHYYILKVTSKSLVLKEYYDGKLMGTDKYKLKKRLSKFVS